MNQPDEISQIDRQELSCQLFQQQLDACLDGRGRLVSLGADPHLESCVDCRISFDIYRQFDRAGGAVLNGGARYEGRPRKRSQSPYQSSYRRSPLTAVAMALAAALMIIVVTLPQDGLSNGESAAALDVPPSNVVAETAALPAVQSLTSANDVSSKLWNPNNMNELRSAIGYTHGQPTVSHLYEVGTISQRLLARSLISPLAGGRKILWENPWQYTSELPGIRPFHRSVNVALVLYNDSMTVL